MKQSRSVLAALVFFSGCASVSPSGTTLTFTRDGSSQHPIAVRLRWARAAEPPIYTPRGAMREVIISEAGRSITVPADQISAIEDIWPERVQLHSACPGDYDLHLPYEVGEGSLALVRVRGFRVSEVRDIPSAHVAR